MELPNKAESKTISLPSWLWEFIESYSAERGVDRSALIQRACREFLLRSQDSLKHWDRLYHDLNDE